MPIVGANLYEIGYCLIGADIFSKNIVKYPPFFPRDEEVSNKLVAFQPSSGQHKGLGLPKVEKKVLKKELKNNYRRPATS